MHHGPGDRLDRKDNPGFTPLDVTMTTAKNVFAILARIRREMNGAVAQAMRQRGIRYNLNYGVSIPTVKDIAAQYAPDHPLAETLWKQDVRELKLAAVIVEDPSKVTQSQMERWIADSPAGELVEYAAMNLFWKAPDALAIAVRWISMDNKSADPKVSAHKKNLRTAAFCIAGKIAGNKTEEAGEQTGSREINIPGETTRSNTESLLLPFVDSLYKQIPEEKAAIFALREIYRFHVDLRPAIRKALEFIASDPAAAGLLDELQWQIEYL